jgi:hypothetical protein
LLAVTLIDSFAPTYAELFLSHQRVRAQSWRTSGRLRNEEAKYSPESGVLTPRADAIADRRTSWRAMIGAMIVEVHCP